MSPLKILNMISINGENAYLLMKSVLKRTLNLKQEFDVFGAPDLMKITSKKCKLPDEIVLCVMHVFHMKVSALL